jgi:hypothetical protein
MLWAVVKILSVKRAVSRATAESWLKILSLSCKLHLYFCSDTHVMGNVPLSDLYCFFVESLSVTKTETRASPSHFSQRAELHLRSIANIRLTSRGARVQKNVPRFFFVEPRGEPGGLDEKGDRSGR